MPYILTGRYNRWIDLCEICTKTPNKKLHALHKQVTPHSRVSYYDLAFWFAWSVQTNRLTINEKDNKKLQAAWQVYRGMQRTTCRHAKELLPRAHHVLFADETHLLQLCCCA
jgi:hypothetical protein